MNSAHAAVQQERCRDMLDAHVVKLHARTAAFPINLGRLCSELGVSLVYKEGISRFNAYVADSGRKWETAAVFLPPEGFGSNYERFCIAHEIAHLLLFRELDAKPQDGSEYWRFEELCDDFARKLLIPEGMVKSHLGQRDPISALKVSFTLTRVSRVPWIHAARRISEFQPDVYFLRLAVAVAERIKILASTFPNHKERGRLIEEPTQFTSLIRSLPNHQPWEPIYVTSDLLGTSKVPSLTDALEGAICAKHHGTSSDVFFAITS
jgi:hypothetical protein